MSEENQPQEEIIVVSQLPEEDTEGSLEELVAETQVEKEVIPGLEESDDVGELFDGQTEVRFPVEDIREVSLENVDIALPSGTQRDMLNRRAVEPRDIRDSATTEQAVFIQSLENGYTARMNNDLYHREVHGDRASHWAQVVEADGALIGARKPAIKETGVRLTGREAKNRVRSLLGLGGSISIPLYHSGFWVEFESPDEEAILAFHNRVTQDRIALGRKLSGAALANESVHLNKTVLEFCLDWISSTSLKEGKEAILDNLSALDIQHMAWGLACAIYQNGFHFARPVLTENEDEHAIQTGHINLTKLQWVDSTLLTPKQRQILRSHRAKVSKETLDVYREEMRVGSERVVELSEQVKVTLAVPTARQHVEAGLNWVDGIVEMIDESFTITGGIDERNQYINRQSKSTQMRQFDHWVKAVHVRNPAAAETSDNAWEVYERDELGTVELLLGDLSTEDNIRQLFFNSVRDYMNDSVIALIATTAGSEYEEQESMKRFANLYPLDAVAVFFQLLTRRVALVEQRSSL